MASGAMRFNDFVQAHRPQLASVPKTLWKPIHRKLCWDTEPSELDLLVVDEARWGVTASSSLTEPLDPESQVFVVDNIIAFTREGLRETLGNDDKAAERLRAALSRRGLDVSTEAGLMRGVWLVADAAQMTVLGADGKPQTQYLWYVPGEQIIGMAHSDEPNFESRIFFDMIRMVPVMLLWPTKPVQPGEPCTRNLLAACRDAQERLALMFAWLLEHELADPALPQQIREAALAPDPPSIVDLRGEEAATDAKSDGEEARKLLPPKDEYLVFSPDVAKHLFKASLDGSRFKLTTNADEADIIWTAESFDRTKLKQGQFVNAFPNQSAIVVKDLLRECVYRYWGQSRAAAWFPRTFNLNYETLDFIGAFIDGSAKQPDSNVWIIKPWNGTRSEGITVSNWMPEILKQMVSGPKIASKYVHPPALLDGKFKFDLRVLVVVDSVEPLRMFTVPSAIYAREAHVEYDHRLEKLDSFENHFTVMSYRGLPVVRSPLPEIVQRMEACFASRSASFERDLLPRMLAVIRKGIEAAVGVGRAEREAGWSGPTKGMLPDAQAKSLYGADVMFDSEMNAYLLEVSAVPDTGRVMDVWPTLYSDLFEFLFAGSDKASSRFVAF